jgi:hypothetical protein
LSTCWVVDCACSINLTAHRTDFLSFSPSKHMSTVVVLVLSFTVVAKFDFAFSLDVPFPATFLHSILPTSSHGPLSASAAYSVLVGCNNVAAVKYLSLRALTLAPSLSPHAWES